ncbi:zinc ribbon domain-containing protein [Methanobrevibacter sp.]|uniref:zinc ribbon domain-containing protein n=1 Tax=Methanobrevibacter sp. TaxID=66852 RepID=UPI00389051AA
MEKYCKNCGAPLNENAQFCPDCGREVEHKRKHTHKFCPNCGEKIDYDENFCRHCGAQIKAPQPVRQSVLEKHKTPILIATVIIIITAFSLIAITSLSPIGGQNVEVDTIGFNIPEDFILDPDSEIDTEQYGIHTSSKVWNKSDDYIQIDVIYSEKYDINETDVLNDLDGKDKNMMGYDGKYDNTGGVYEFSFVEDNKLCSIYTNNPELLEEIEVM